jgi:hypothetical protein
MTAARTAGPAPVAGIPRQTTITKPVNQITGTGANINPPGSLGLPYGQMGALDALTSGAIGNFLGSAPGGAVNLPDLTQYLTATYNPYGFKQPDYTPEEYQAFQFKDPTMTKAEDIKSVADIPPEILNAIWERTTGNIGRTAESQRQDIADKLRMEGGGTGNLLVAALRDINNGEQSQIGEAAIQKMIEDENRNYEEAKNLRALRLGREETLAGQQFGQEQAQAGQNQASYQAGRDEARYMAGLKDTLQTRKAAEAEKAYNAKYGQQQDIVNTKMNQAQFQSAERANQASREQAAIQQGLNYLNQGGNFRINTAQLSKTENKGNNQIPYDILGTAQGAGQVAGALAPTTAKFQQATTYPLTQRMPVNPNQNQFTQTGTYYG